MQTDAQRFFEERNVIKANPLIETLSTTRFVMAFIVVLFLAILILIFVLGVVFGGGPFLSRHSILPLYLFMVVINSFNLAMNIRQLHYWKRIEQRRFTAVQGNQTLLAAEQPTLRAVPMWLPGTLKLCYTKKSWLLMTGLILLMALLLAGTSSFEGPFFTSNRLLFFLVCFCIIAIVFLALLVILLRSTSRQQIEPTEYGLITRFTGKNATVMWSEARLFALYETFGQQKSGASITYELSSAREIVRWTWVQRKTHFMGQVPIAPQDEYNSQMQGFLALVQARTGLPLYDLRQQRVSLSEGGPNHPLTNS